MRFYSVQAPNDVTRLRGGGSPWPTGLQRANLGSGLYTWATLDDAERYQAHLLKHGVVNLVVAVYEIAEEELNRLKKLDLTQRTDEEVTAWLNQYSAYGDAEPHDWEYIIRHTGMGGEHYFASHVFHQLREVL